MVLSNENLRKQPRVDIDRYIEIIFPTTPQIVTIDSTQLLVDSLKSI